MTAGMAVVTLLPKNAPEPDLVADARPIVDAILLPAHLEARDGRLLYANRAARRAVAAPRIEGCPESHRCRIPIRFGEGLATLVVQVTGRCEGDVRVPRTVPEVVAMPRRYQRIAALAVRGLSDKEIAACTGVSYNTVRTYMRAILQRAGVHSRMELVCRCRRPTIPPPEGPT